MFDYSTLLINGVYLIHAHKKLHHAQHYIGYSSNIAVRIAMHKQGHGSKLIKAFNDNGITWEVARIWQGETRTFERMLHDSKRSPYLCPICNQQRIAHKLKLVSILNQPVTTHDMLLLTQADIQAVTPL
jgi:predicted GIY-YIG superfamily endonuclease